MRGSLLLLLSILGSAAGALLPRSHPEGGRSTQRGGRTRSQRMIVLEQQCREFASSLQLPPCTEQQDAVRSRLQHTIRSNRKWRDAHVHAYGSTACGLHTAASDFDFTVCGARFAREDKQACLQQAAAHCRAVELASPAPAEILTQRDLAQDAVRKATRLHADQVASFTSKARKLVRFSEAVASSGRSVHERALSLWPLASVRSVLTRSSRGLRTVRSRGAGQLAAGLHVLYVPPDACPPRACRAYRVPWHPQVSLS